MWIDHSGSLVVLATAAAARPAATVQHNVASGHLVAGRRDGRFSSFCDAKVDFVTGTGIISLLNSRSRWKALENVEECFEFMVSYLSSEEKNLNRNDIIIMKNIFFLNSVWSRSGDVVSTDRCDNILLHFSRCRSADNH